MREDAQRRGAGQRQADSERKIRAGCRHAAAAEEMANQQPKAEPTPVTNENEAASAEPKATAAEEIVRMGIKIIAGDEDTECSWFSPDVSGVTSIDSFIARVIDRQERYIYDTLCEMIPNYMKVHSIIKQAISNRKQRMLRQINIL